TPSPRSSTRGRPWTTQSRGSRATSRASTSRTSNGNQRPRLPAGGAPFVRRGMRKASYSVTRLQNHGYLFILPTLVFFAVFLIYPMVSDFRYSLFDWNVLTPPKDIGLKNFAAMLKDTRVINSVLRTLHFSAVSVVAINVLAFAFALLFASRLIRRKNLLQS